MKHDAIVEQGIPIHERVPIPDDMIPEDSRVEIDAKIHAGYCKCMDVASIEVELTSLSSHERKDYDHGRTERRARPRVGGRRRKSSTHIVIRVRPVH